MNKLSILIFTVFVAAYAAADDVGRGGYAGSYLRLGLGSAGMAMGGGSVALVRDGCTSYYNPAGLVFLEKRWATASLHSMALDRKLFHVGYAQSIKAKRSTRGKAQQFIRGGFSLGWICAGVDKIDGRDFDGKHTDMLSSWENAFFFSFAMNPAPPIAFGFNGKLLYSRFANVRNDGKAMTTAGFGFDIGIMVRPSQSLTFGLVARDLHSRYSWNSKGVYEQETPTVDTFPAAVRAGAAWTGWNRRVILCCDLEKVEFFPNAFSFGIETRPVDGFFVRCGLVRDALTFGTGIQFIRGGVETVLDYALVPDPVAPRATHVITCSAAF